MPAVQRSDLKFFLSTVLLLVFFSCSKKSDSEKSGSRKNEEILYIGVSNVGGQLGNYRTIKINQDSLHIEQGLSSSNQHKEKHIALKPETWKKLCGVFNLKTLDRIKSSTSIQPINGIDESFQIKTTKKSHVYVNAYEDPNYIQFENFKTELAKIIPPEFQPEN